MDSSNADRNLLYGVLALQMGLITRDDLIGGLIAWASDRAKPLAQVLIERKALAPDDHPHITHAVRRLQEKHQEDPSACLGSLGFEVVQTVQGLLQTIPDPELQASLTHIAARESGRDLDATTAWAHNGPLAQAAATPPAPPRDGQDHGTDRFVPRRLHAKGGLGEVHVAWDRELGREVALKEIRPEYADKEQARIRFIREAEVNANLEHPGIVPVYALGTHPDGRPYYAMRFVQGETLKTALERVHDQAPQQSATWWTLQIRGLLRHLLVICDAIEYAHSRGVLHRDLKPDNILLGKYGETLIIDWGLAKVLGRADAVLEAKDGSILAFDPALGSGSLQGSRLDVDPVVLHSSQGESAPSIDGQALGSPPYMSPEQAQGLHEQLDHSTDVYSLGATLYAVLTGRQPVRGATVKEIIAKVVRGDIDPTTTVNPRVPKPLEAIRSKAMALKPEDRYPSARALAQDLERWLADQPIEVYDDPWTTRLRRWARQHRSLVAASGALLLATLVGLTASTIVVGQQKRKAEIAKEKAEIAQLDAERSRSEARTSAQIGLQVVEQLVNLGDRQLVTQSSPAQRQKFLKLAVQFVDRFRELDPNDIETQTTTALVSRRLANLYRLTGQYDQADPFYNGSLTILEELHLRGPNDPEYRDLLAETLLDQGEAQVAQGQIREAEIAYQRALELARGTAQRTPQDPRYQRTLAHCLIELAATHLALGHNDAATLAQEAVQTIRPQADKALPTLRASYDQGNNITLIDQISLIEAQGHQATALGRAGEPALAETLLREAQDRIEQIGTAMQDLDMVDVDFRRAQVGLLLAGILTAQGPVQNAEAAQRLDDAVTRLERLVLKYDQVPRYQSKLAEALLARARTLDRDAAESIAQETYERLKTLAEAHPKVPEPTALMAEALGLLGNLALQAQPPRRDEARDRLAAAVRLAESALALSPDNLAYKTQRDDLKQRLGGLVP